MFAWMSTALESACDCAPRHIIQLAVKPQPWAGSIVCPKCFRQACLCLASLKLPWSNTVTHTQKSHTNNMTVHSRETTQNQTYSRCNNDTAKLAIRTHTHTHHASGQVNKPGCRIRDQIQRGRTATLSLCHINHRGCEMHST